MIVFVNIKRKRQETNIKKILCLGVFKNKLQLFSTVFSQIHYF
jgi:hypothetical protein